MADEYERATLMDRASLERKLTTLAAFPEMATDPVMTFGAHLATLTDWDLMRMNPLAVAEHIGFDPQQTIDLFLHGAKIGLFDFSWNLVCPSCGLTEYRYTTIGDMLSTHFHCTICRVHRPVTLDSQVEVSFTINPTVKKLEIDPLADWQSYTRYFFSPNIKDSLLIRRYHQATHATFQVLQPDTSARIDFHAEPGKLYTLRSLELHAIADLTLTDAVADGPQTISIDIVPTGFVPHEIALARGPVHLQINNVHTERAASIFGITDLALQPEEDDPAEFTPFLNGKMLLNTQSFRSLFRVQSLRPDLRLNLRSVTVLFTDLKGSTDLYDLAGDAFAYELIQDHFRVLGNAIRSHAGAIVKTMGDAVMATFSTPQEAVRAAFAMMHGIDTLNERLSDTGYRLGLKVGLHEGATLAVNAEDRLDYFGQTVNIAARVQGLAKADEIWVTEPVFLASQGLHPQQGYQAEQHSVSLKGVREPTTVYRLYRA